MCTNNPPFQITRRITTTPKYALEILFVVVKCYNALIFRWISNQITDNNNNKADNRRGKYCEGKNVLYKQNKLL